LIAEEIKMRMSESVSNLATALAKAQGEIDDAAKAGFNPAFKSKYADLSSVRAAIREPLAVNDLSIVQFPRTVPGGVEVETMLLHKSGEYLSETLMMPLGKQDAHGVGSAITYGRRYGLMAILCLASDDDDGNAAAERAPAKQPAAPPAPKVDPEVIAEAIAAGKELAATKGTTGAAEWWASLPNDVRAAIPDAAKANIKKIGSDNNKTEGK